VVKWLSRVADSMIVGMLCTSLKMRWIDSQPVLEKAGSAVGDGERNKKARPRTIATLPRTVERTNRHI